MGGAVSPVHRGPVRKKKNPGPWGVATRDIGPSWPHGPTRGPALAFALAHDTCRVSGDERSDGVGCGFGYRSEPAFDPLKSDKGGIGSGPQINSGGRGTVPGRLSTSLLGWGGGGANSPLGLIMGPVDPGFPIRGHSGSNLMDIVTSGFGWHHSCVVPTRLPIPGWGMGNRVHPWAGAGGGDRILLDQMTTLEFRGWSRTAGPAEFL